jgi:ubiquinone biosynthesis protein
MDLPLRASIDKLIEAQQQQAQWQKRLVIAIIALAAIEIAMVTSAFFMH